MIVKCTDKYENKSLDIMRWSFVFVGLGDFLGKFVIFTESPEQYQVNRTYEVDFKEFHA